MNQGSDWVEAPQVYWLIGEIIETVERLPPSAPFPCFAAVFAARCFPVQVEPLHPMYIKLNKFIDKAPQWHIRKLLSYWIEKVLLQPPTEDDGFEAELEWLLDFLIDGLRTPSVSHFSCTPFRLCPWTPTLSQVVSISSYRKATMTSPVTIAS